MMIQFRMYASGAYFCDNDFTFCVCDAEGRLRYRGTQVGLFRIEFSENKFKSHEIIYFIKFSTLNVITWEQRESAAGSR